MNFVEIFPKRISLNKFKDYIKVVFKEKEKNKYILFIYIGEGIASNLKIQLGNKISLSYGEDNSRVLFLKKGNDNLNGYSLVSAGRSGRKLQVTWDKEIFIPTPQDLLINIKKHEFYEDGVLIYLDSNIS